MKYAILFFLLSANCLASERLIKKERVRNCVKCIPENTTYIVDKFIYQYACFTSGGEGTLLERWKGESLFSWRTEIREGYKYTYEVTKTPLSPELLKKYGGLCK